jgi:hypothetical protein
MKCFSAVVVGLGVLATPAPGQEQPKGQGTAKSFTYKKAKQVVGHQDQVGLFVVHVEDERRPVQVEVLLAQVAVHEGQPAAVALGVVGGQGGGDPDLLQHAAQRVPLGLRVPAGVAVVVEQLAGRHPAKLFDAVADGHGVYSMVFMAISFGLISFGFVIFQSCASS